MEDVKKESNNDKIESRVEKTIKREMLKKILMSDNIAETLNEEKNRVFKIIPELQAEVGFDQRHPHHCYDVWQHTVFALSKSDKDYETRLALLLHDIGKPFSYQDDDVVRHFKGHPEVSAKMTEEILTNLEYNDKEIQDIKYLVENHDHIIDVNEITDSKQLGLVKKLLNIQFCDAYAHAPEHVQKRIDVLNGIKKEIRAKETEIKNIEKNKKVYKNFQIDKEKEDAEDTER